MAYAAFSTVASMKDISESLKYASRVLCGRQSLDHTTTLMRSFAKTGSSHLKGDSILYL
jgi:hypothetical protein